MPERRRDLDLVRLEQRQQAELERVERGLSDLGLADPAAGLVPGELGPERRGPGRMSKPETPSPLLHFNLNRILEALARHVGLGSFATIS